MSRATQSRAQTEANAKTLRALVKHPDNKVCVDCKKNDPRWASWNIGCFLCIRCSGIHRSMGTHISKVKSIDLDIWTPEQMESVQKWGNRRCNLYWEAHLKAGHVPADHKIESFIRSKYESRRWAKDGPPPPDPAVLDGAAVPPAAPTSSGTTSAAAKPAASVAPSKAVAIDLLDQASPSPTPSPAPAPSTSAKSATLIATPASAKSSGGGGIFDLDWHDPSPSTATKPSSPSASASGAKGKNDIMSLFAAARPPPSTHMENTSTTGGFGDFGSFSSGPSTTPNPAPATGAGAGVGGLALSFGGLDLSSSSASARAPTSSNPWSTTMNNNTSNGATNGGGAGGLFDTQNVWGTTTGSTVPAPATASKNDAFADIWGDFK